TSFNAIMLCNSFIKVRIFRKIENRSKSFLLYNIPFVFGRGNCRAYIIAITELVVIQNLTAIDNLSSLLHYFFKGSLHVVYGLFVNHWADQSILIQWVPDINVFVYFNQPFF